MAAETAVFTKPNSALAAETLPLAMNLVT